MNTIIGIFDDPIAARRAMERLRDGPLMLEDVSIISRDADVSGASSEDVSAGEGAAVGAVWGGLVGLTALLIPGIGPFVAGGALFAALTGAVTGAVVGGISAALIDFSGIPESEARGYEDEVSRGKTLVAVKARDEDSAEVQRLLSADGASSVRDSMHTGTAAAGMDAPGAPPRIAMYDAGGRRVEQAIAVGAASGAAAGTRRYGLYDYPEDGGRADMGTRQTGRGWTSGEMVADGEGDGPRRTTGTYDADQWVGEGQGPGETPGDTWTSGQMIPDTDETAPRQNTGAFDSEQWVGEGQGDTPATDDRTKRRP